MTQLPTRSLFYPEETQKFLSILTGGGLPASDEYQVIDNLINSSRTRKLPPEFAKDGKLHPLSIARAVFGDYRKKSSGFDLSEHEAKTLAEVIRYSFPTDPITGYKNNECMPYMVGVAHLFAQSSSSPPVCLVEGDIINLGGVNRFFIDQCQGDEAKGREKSNLYIHEICRLTRETIKNKGGADVEVQAIRSGGDEVRLVVYGMEQEKLDTLLKEQVTPRIHELTAKLGLHTTPHTKVNEDKTPGAGLVFGCVSLNGTKSVEALQEDLEQQIKVNKQVDGFLRNNIMFNSAKGRESDSLYAEHVAHYINETFIPFIKRKYPEKTDSQIATQDVQQLKESAAEAKVLWEKFVGKGGYFNSNGSIGFHYDNVTLMEAKSPPGFVELDKASGESFYSQIDARSMGYKIKFNELLDDKAHDGSDRPKSRDDSDRPKTRVYTASPFTDKSLPRVLTDPLPVGRLRNVINEMAGGDKNSPFYKLAHDEGEIAQWYEGKDRHYVIQDWALQKYFPDPASPEARKLQLAVACTGLLDSSHPVSRSRSTRFLQSDAEMLLDSSPEQRMGLVKVQLLNLSGLNNVSYEFGNAVLRELGTAIKTTLKKLPPELEVPSPHNLDIYDCGNGVFSILLPSSISRITQDKIAREIERNVQERITDKGVIEFANETMAHPREGRDSEVIINKLRADMQRVTGTKGTLAEKDWSFDEIVHPRGERKGVDVACEVMGLSLTQKDRGHLLEIITKPILMPPQLSQLPQLPQLQR